MTADAVGGVLTYALDLIAGLTRADDEVVLVTFGRAADADQRRRIIASGVTRWHESELALEWMDEPWRDLQVAGELLLDLERETAPDVIHLNAYGHAALPWRAPVLAAAHSDVWSWWEAVHGDTPPLPYRRYRRWVRSGLAAADAVVAPSAAMLEVLIRHYGPMPAPTSVIHNASASPPAPAGVRKRPFALAAGRMWDAAKNLGTLTAAAGRLPAGSVRIAGEGGGEAEEGGVRFLGALGAAVLAVHRRQAAVFVAPARYEPFGLAILEAARDRCALVLGDIPSLRELWGSAARYVSPDDPEGLAATLRELLADPLAATALGARAQRHAERYAVDHMVSGYRDLYRGLAQAPGRAVAR
jgi:glycogen(starch) synthase